MSSGRLLACGAVLLMMAACSARTDAEPRRSLTYRCGDGRSFEVEQRGKMATIDFAGTRFQLPRRKSSIGARYASRDATLIVDGESAVFVTPRIVDLKACRALRS